MRCFSCFWLRCSCFVAAALLVSACNGATTPSVSASATGSSHFLDGPRFILSTIGFAVFTTMFLLLKVSTERTAVLLSKRYYKTVSNKAIEFSVGFKKQ